MRMLTASIVLGPLLLIGGLAAAGQPISAPGPGASVRLAADDDSASDRDGFTRKAQDQIEDWQRKLQDFNEQAAAQGKKAGDDAERDLNKAWNDARAASRKLQTVGAESWQSAKTTFEKASRDLTNVWNRVKPQDK